jgi:hypothetical protein
MYWLQGDSLTLPEGVALTLRYRVVVHSGDAKEARISRLFEEYTLAAEAEQSGEDV